MNISKWFPKKSSNPDNKSASLPNQSEGGDAAVAVSEKFGVPIVDLDCIELQPDIVKLVDQSLIEKHLALPIFKRGNRLFIAVSDPTNPGIQEIGFETKMVTEAILVEEEKLAKVIECDPLFESMCVEPDDELALPEDIDLDEDDLSLTLLDEDIESDQENFLVLTPLQPSEEECSDSSSSIETVKPELAPSVVVDLHSLEQDYQEYIMENGQQEVDIALIHARLADHYRDMELDFITPNDFRSLTEQLDEAAQQRLALLVAGLDNEVLKQAIPKCVKTDVKQQVRICFLSFAIETDLLTIELLRQSSLRVEEFARQFLKRLGAGIEDETYAESKQRLKRLDYRSLLNQAKQAQVSAEERMDYLRQLQEEQERRMGRRGKW